MVFSFPELIAHAARTRRLRTGTIIGSGTVPNRAAGSSCLAEKRVIEKVDFGESGTRS
jgi:fumarylacetoacetate (FAA) hydrolase